MPSTVDSEMSRVLACSSVIVLPLIAIARIAKDFIIAKKESCS
jgi:hypothetical protein